MMSSSDLGDSSEAPTSSGQASNTSGYSVPSESDVATGRHLLNKWLRSIVMSRTAFLLFHGFNPTTTRSSTRSISTSNVNGSMPDFTVVTTKDEDHGQLLLNSFKKFTNETNITREMGRLLHEIYNKKGPNRNSKMLTAFVEASVKISPLTKKCPRLDVTWGEKVGGSLCGFVEVGLTPAGTPASAVAEKVDQLFWKKVDQAIRYLNLVTKMKVEGKDPDGGQCSLCVDINGNKTLLICVIAMARDRRFGRIAIFACEPKAGGAGGWRMALMWRKEAEAAVISKAFGYYIAAMKYMADNEFNLDVEMEEWAYMGPNCSKVTVQGCAPLVYRSYDNRVRQTSRSPLVYYNWEKIKATTEVVVAREEGGAMGGNTIEFREAGYLQQSTLFRSDGKCGKVEVISVPFINGKHDFSTIEDALHMVIFLKDMHAAYIHGDIRALNCVFAGKHSAMIDHDFGGTEKDSYPPGYVPVLPDGRRGDIKNTNLSKSEDVEALLYIITVLHRPKKGTSSEDVLNFVELGQSTSLDDLEHQLRRFSVNTRFEPERQYAKFLLDYTKKRGAVTKQTLDGDPETPERDSTLLSTKKRPAPSASQPTVASAILS